MAFGSSKKGPAFSADWHGGRFPSADRQHQRASEAGAFLLRDVSFSFRHSLALDHLRQLVRSTYLWPETHSEGSTPISFASSGIGRHPVRTRLEKTGIPLRTIDITLAAAVRFLSVTPSHSSAWEARGDA